MILPGFFLEYLVTGSCALFWIYGLFAIFGHEKLLQVDSSRALLIAPALYVVGMIVDFVSRTSLMQLRDWKGKSGEDTEKSQMNYAGVLARSPDLARQIELRSSRDRIARGAAGNLFFATITFTILSARAQASTPWYVVLLAGLLVCAATIAMWWRFNRLPASHEQQQRPSWNPTN